MAKRKNTNIDRFGTPNDPGFSLRNKLKKLTPKKKVPKGLRSNPNKNVG